jgi:hypothetical protein
VLLFLFAEQSQSMLATRTRFFQKLIKKLNTQVRARHLANALNCSQVSELQNEAGSANAARAEATQQERIQDRSRAGLENERLVRTLENRVDDLEEMVRAAETEAEFQIGQADRTRQASQRMLNLQDESVTFLLMCMEDVKLAGGAHEAGESKQGVPDDLTKLGPQERLAVLETLLVKLNPNRGGVPPGLFEAPADHHQQQQQQQQGI